MHHILIGRVYLSAQNLTLEFYMRCIASDCSNMADLLSSCLWIIFPLGCVFYSLFAYDMLNKASVSGSIAGSGDYTAALIMLLAAITITVLKYLVMVVHQYAARSCSYDVMCHNFSTWLSSKYMQFIFPSVNVNRNVDTNLSTGIDMLGSSFGISGDDKVCAMENDDDDRNGGELNITNLNEAVE